MLFPIKNIGKICYNHDTKRVSISFTDHWVVVTKELSVAIALAFVGISAWDTARGVFRLVIGILVDSRDNFSGYKCKPLLKKNSFSQRRSNSV